MSLNNTLFDLIDRKIMYELDFDCRQSNSQIARKIGQSKEVVNYRIKKLESNHIISHYQAIINFLGMGRIQFKVCASLQQINSDALGKIINQLKAIDEIKWIVECKGRWDLILSLETSSLIEVSALKTQVGNIIGIHLKDQEVAILTEGCVYPRGFLIDDGSGLYGKKRFTYENKKAEIDEIDDAIISLLVEDGRMPVTEISKRLGITPRIAAHRIRSLRKKGVILGFKIALQYQAFGLRFYKTFIELQHASAEKIKEFETFLDLNKNVIHNGRVISKWDYEPEFEVFSEQEFDNHVAELRERFYDIIKTFDTITIIKEHMFVYY